MLSTHIPDLSKAACKKQKNTGPELEQGYSVRNTQPEKSCKTCPYLSSIGTVNAVLPFIEHMHGTAIT